MKTALLTIVLLLLFAGKTLAQVDDTKFVYTGQTDSVVLAVYHYSDKETGSEVEDISKIRSEHLFPSEIESLNKRLLNNSSFVFQRALLYHFNVMISYYVKDSLVQTLTFSTLTGNITIEKFGCSPKHKIDKKTKEETVTDVCLYAYKTTRDFAYYFRRLLRMYGLWQEVDEGDKLFIGDEEYLPD
jgi:hypothetical protein